MSARGELLADGGAASASSGDFFRCAEFLAAEGATHSLRVETPAGSLVAPLLVRSIPGKDHSDAISPYGYPGLVPERDIDTPARPCDATGPIDSTDIDWSPTGLVSLFIRHRLAGVHLASGSRGDLVSVCGDNSPRPGVPILAEPLAGTTERNIVQIADPALERKSRASDRQQIRRNEREGYEVEVAGGPETSPVQRAGFFSAYTQTMVRTEAASRYFFDAAYFDTLLESSQARLFLVRSPDGEVAAGSLVVESDGMLHYYLSGTADPYLRDSPMKTLLNRLVDTSEEEGLPVNFGGGITPGDPLEEFKRGFANREETWRTSEIVCDEAAYAELSAEVRAPTGVFPAYRAGG